MRERFVTLAIPRAYVFGERSLPDPDYEWLADRGIAVATIANAGHGMMDDNPEGCAHVLAGLLRQPLHPNS
jgi:pimeloyl-ACP methyl ester carboxylesterase